MPSRPKLTIPKRAQNAFRTLLHFGEGELAGLEEAFRSVPPALTGENYSAAVAKAANIDEQVVIEIVGALMGLYLLKNKEHREASDVANAVTEALSDVPDLGVDLNDSTLGNFASRLGVLLSLDETIGITSKAFDVMSQHANVYMGSNSRVVTDVRPIFGGDTITPPKAAVIVHNLVIGYLNDEESRTFHVALDPEELRELKTLLDRALEKETHLKTTLEAAGVRYLGPDTDAE